MEHLRGDGYDGASSMAGKTDAVQASVRETYPAALHMHCASHSLPLVLCAGWFIADIKNCFGTVKETARFFRKSANRTVTPREMISVMSPVSRRQRLLGLCKTGWVEKSDALLFFVGLFEPVIAALEEIKSKENPESSGQGNNLTLTLLAPGFLLSLHVTEHALAVTLPLSKKLQAKNTDLSAAIADIDVVKPAIQNDRTNAEKSSSKMFAKVQELAGILNVEITSRRVGIRQQTRVNMLAETPKEYFRRSYVHIIRRLHIGTTEPAL